MKDIEEIGTKFFNKFCTYKPNKKGGYFVWSYRVDPYDIKWWLMEELESLNKKHEEELKSEKTINLDSFANWLNKQNRDGELKSEYYQAFIVLLGTYQELD